MREHKVVVLGSGGVGKSAVTIQFVQSVFVEKYDPTIEDSYRKHLTVDNNQSLLEVLDTAGTEQFTAMRDLYLKNGSGFILMYSITSLSSFEELIDLYDQVIRVKGSSKIPIVLVGNKCDLELERVISSEQGLNLAESWGRVRFLETSARYRINVDEVFIELVRLIQKQLPDQTVRRRKLRRCTII